MIDRRRTQPSEPAGSAQRSRASVWVINDPVERSGPEPGAQRLPRRVVGPKPSGRAGSGMPSVVPPLEFSSALGEGRKRSLGVQQAFVVGKFAVKVFPG